MALQRTVQKRVLGPGANGNPDDPTARSAAPQERPAPKRPAAAPKPAPKGDTDSAPVTKA